MVAWVCRLGGNPSCPFFVCVCHPGITQLLRGGQLTAIHPLISAATMLEFVLGVGGGRLEPDCGAGFEDVFKPLVCKRGEELVTPRCCLNVLCFNYLFQFGERYLDFLILFCNNPRLIPMAILLKSV